MIDQQHLFDRFWEFYYNKHDENFDKAAEEIRRLDITELDIEDGRVTIKLRRPGILIGVKGNNITDLIDFLGTKVHIEEEPQASIADRIIPYYWDEDF